MLGLASGILVARLLGPGGRGELAAIITWVSLVSYFGNLGLPAAYVYAAAREPGRSRQLLGNGILAVLVQWPVLAIVGFAVVTLALANYGAQTRQLAAIYLFSYTPISLLVLYANAIQQGRGQYGRFNAVRLSVPFAYVLGILALQFGNIVTVAGVLVANVGSNVVALLLSLVLLVPLLGGERRGEKLFDLAGLKRDLRYGLSAQLGTMQLFNGLRIDVLLLTLLLSTHEVGIYVAALAGAQLIKAQGIALGMIVMPEVAKSSDSHEARRSVMRFAGAAALLGGCTAAVAVAWAEPLIKWIYGGEFLGAASLLRILAISAVIASVYRVLADGLRGIGRPMSGTVAELASVAVGVPAILVLVPFAGAGGAAFAVGLSSLAAFVVVSWALLRATPRSNVDMNLRDPAPRSEALPGRVD